MHRKPYIIIQGVVTIIIALSMLFCALVVVFDRCLIVSEEAARSIEVARRYRPEPEEEMMEPLVEEIGPEPVLQRPTVN